MKAFLENFAAIVGVFTLTILAMSWCHEYGYFWSIGRQFQTFLSTTDYLTNDVLWLPVALFSVYNFIEWWRLRDEGPPTIDWKKKQTWAWLVWQRLLPRTELDAPWGFVFRQALRLGPPLLIGMFLYGSVDANFDLTRTDEPYAFQFKNEQGKHLRIFLRTFDKGVLARNPVDNTLEFYKWDDITGISRRNPGISKSFFCWLTGWSCKSEIQVAP